MKTLIASVTTVFVLASGVSLTGVSPMTPQWFCKMFPIFCPKDA